MADVGTRVSVASNAPETGRYRHTATGCANTIILNKGNNVPPCQLPECPQKGADWILVEKLTWSSHGMPEERRFLEPSPQGTPECRDYYAEKLRATSYGTGWLSSLAPPLPLPELLDKSSCPWYNRTNVRKRRWPENHYTVLA